MNIKILDCTLRDGGYVNNWNFGFNNIKNIINNLSNANIDYIECGFLKKIKYNKKYTLFSSINDFKNLKIQTNKEITLMINFGEFNIDDIPENCPITFRIAFKKDDLKKALDFCKKIKNKNNKIFINPMYTNTYSTNELLYLINEVNKIEPSAFTIVDSAGAMKENDLLSIFHIIDRLLNPSIALCFHSHDNLKLSFEDAKSLIKVCKLRELIVDSTIFGIGRGAGNLQTEVITQYINEHCKNKYNLIPILKSLNEQIKPIFDKTPWGYTVPYYLAAINSCHPNYAKFLDEKQVPVENIDKILKKIPTEYKYNFDRTLIENCIK